MHNLRSMSGRQLHWVRLSPFKRTYELRSGETPVAEIKFEKPIGWTATATTGEGTWIFERSGFLRSRIAIRDAATTEIANIPEHRGRRRQQILLANGSSYAIRRNFLGTQFALETASGEGLAFINRIGIFRQTWQTEIRYRAKSITGMPWLVMLVWYYILVLRSRSRAQHGAG